ncbi:MAG: chain length determinant protein EpsF [Pseudomonadota bacterium]
MNLQRLLLILRARVWIVLFTLVVTVASAALVSYLLPKSYTANVQLVVDFKHSDPITGAGTAPHAQLLSGQMATQKDILLSHRVALKVVDSLQLDANPDAQEQFEKATEGRGSIRDWLADMLLKDVEVEPSADSSMINLSYTSTDPRFASAVANAFAQAYIKTSLELRIEPAREVAGWFNEQLKILRSNLETAQTKLSSYQQQNGIVATDERLDIENARLAELSTQLVTAQAQTQDTLSRQNQAQSSPDKGIALESLPEVIANPYIQGLKAELARQEARLSELSGVGKNHPQYQRALADIENMRKKINAEIINATGGIVNNAQLATQREAALKAMLAAQKARVLELRKQRDDISVLMRDVENAQRAYDTALQRFNETNMESQLSQTNVTLLTPAIEPIEPSHPKALLNVALAIFFGGLLGVGLALMTEMANRYIRSEEDVSEDLGLPVVGVLVKRQANVKAKKHPGKFIPGLERLLRAA